MQPSAWLVQSLTYAKVMPFISLVEAKDEDLDWGLGQCAAQVYGAHRFNIAEGNEMPVLYGCATTGIEWQFLRFENDTFYVDTNVLTDVPIVLGTWHWILNYYINTFKK